MTSAPEVGVTINTGLKDWRPKDPRAGDPRTRDPTI